MSIGAVNPNDAATLKFLILIPFADEEDDEDKSEDDDWEPFIPEEPSPILQAFYDPNAGNEEKNFWVSMVSMMRE